MKRIKTFLEVKLQTKKRYHGAESETLYESKRDHAAELESLYVPNRQSRVEESLNCRRCYKPYGTGNSSPKILPCLHPVCRLCIASMITKSDDFIVKCPKCERETKIPQEHHHKPLIKVIETVFPDYSNCSNDVQTDPCDHTFDVTFTPNGLDSGIEGSPANNNEQVKITDPIQPVNETFEFADPYSLQSPNPVSVPDVKKKRFVSRKTKQPKVFEPDAMPIPEPDIPKEIPGVKCSEHYDKDCVMACLDCFQPLCMKCLNCVRTGPHAGHSFENIEDGRADLQQFLHSMMKERVKNAFAREESMKKDTKACSDATNSAGVMIQQAISQWKKNCLLNREQQLAKKSEVCSSVKEPQRETLETTDFHEMGRALKDIEKQGKGRTPFQPRLEEEELINLQVAINYTCDRIRRSIKHGVMGGDEQQDTTTDVHDTFSLNDAQTDACDDTFDDTLTSNDLDSGIEGSPANNNEQVKITDPVQPVNESFEFAGPYSLPCPNPDQQQNLFESAQPQKWSISSHKKKLLIKTDDMQPLRPNTHKERMDYIVNIFQRELPKKQTTSHKKMQHVEPDALPISVRDIQTKRSVTRKTKQPKVVKPDANPIPVPDIQTKRSVTRKTKQPKVVKPDANPTPVPDKQTKRSVTRKTKQPKVVKPDANPTPAPDKQTKRSVTRKAKQPKVVKPDANPTPAPDKQTKRSVTRKTKQPKVVKADANPIAVPDIQMKKSAARKKKLLIKTNNMQPLRPNAHRQIMDYTGEIQTEPPKKQTTSHKKMQFVAPDTLPISVTDVKKKRSVARKTKQSKVVERDVLPIAVIDVQTKMSAASETKQPKRQADEDHRFRFV